jgi:hypothetical protein
MIAIVIGIIFFPVIILLAIQAGKGIKAVKRSGSRTTNNRLNHASYT